MMFEEISAKIELELKLNDWETYPILDVVLIWPSLESERFTPDIHTRKYREKAPKMDGMAAPHGTTEVYRCTRPLFDKLEDEL